MKCVDRAVTVRDRGYRERIVGGLGAVLLVESRHPDRLVLGVPDEGVVQGEQYRGLADEYDVGDHRQHSHQFLLVLRLVELVLTLLAGEADLVGR